MKRLTISHLRALPLVAFALAIAGCTGSGPVTTAGMGETASSVTRVDPSISNLDTARSAATSSESVGLSASKAIGSAVGDDSVSGCEARQLWNEGGRMSLGPSVFLCYMTTCESAVANCDFSKEDFNYMKITAAGAGPGGEGFRMLIRAKSKDGTQTVHLCEDGIQQESFGFTSNATTRTITYAMKHHMTSGSKDNPRECDTDGNGSQSDAERATCRASGTFDEWGQLDGTVVYDAAAAGLVDSIAETDSATISGLFDGGFGRGEMTVGFDEDGSPTDGQKNTVLGGFVFSFGVGDTGTGFIYSEFNSSQGTAKYSSTGSMPCLPGLPSHLSGCHCPKPQSDSCDAATQFATAGCRVASPAASCYCMDVSTTGSCTFNESGTQSFTVALVGGQPKFKVASTSIFASSVSAKTLPTSVSSITKNFGPNAWDCTAPNGFTEITIPNTTIFAACAAKEAEAFAQSDHDSCWQDQGEDSIGEGKTEHAKLGFSAP